MATSLKVTIVGGGIGGLTTAVALRRAGHKVTVYEKYSLTGEVGAAVGLGPNSMKYLHSLGFDNTRARFCDLKESQILDGRTLELVQILEMAGSGTGTIFRPDLREELRYLAEEGEGPGPPCTLVGFTDVVGIEPDEGVVRLASGAREEADLIVAADGVHSTAMDLVLGRPSPALRSTTTATRAVLPAAELRQNPFARAMASVPGRSTFSMSPDGPGRLYLLTYWCRAYELVNLVLYATGEDDDDDDEGQEEEKEKEKKDVILQPGVTTAPGGEEEEEGGEEEEKAAAAARAAARTAMRGETTRADVAAALAQFHPDLATVCDCLVDVLPLWRQHTRAPAPGYCRGRMVVIGDAAHAMLSHMGQGANAAIFDAAALGTLFADVPDASAAQMARRLRVYDEVRAPLVSATQLWSEVPLFGQPGRKNDEVRLVLPGVDLPEETAQDILKFIQGYDVVKDCRTRLEEHLKVS